MQNCFSAKKLSVRVILLVFLSVVAVIQATACDITFRIEGKKKEKYKIGDELSVVVKVEYSHRVCTIGIEPTKFETDGLQINTQEKWVEICPGVWERKMTLKITGNESGKAVLTATRTCRKEGGKGSLVLETEKL